MAPVVTNGLVTNVEQLGQHGVAPCGWLDPAPSSARPPETSCFSLRRRARLLPPCGLRPRLSAVRCPLSVTRALRPRPSAVRSPLSVTRGLRPRLPPVGRPLSVGARSTGRLRPLARREGADELGARVRSVRSGPHRGGRLPPTESGRPTADGLDRHASSSRRRMCTSRSASMCSQGPFVSLCFSNSAQVQVASMMLPSWSTWRRGRTRAPAPRTLPLSL